MTSSPITVAINFNRQQFRFVFWDSSSCFRLNFEFQIGCCSIVSNKMSQRSRVCICRRCKCSCSFLNGERHVWSHWYDPLKHSHCSSVSRMISRIQRIRVVGLRGWRTRSCNLCLSGIIDTQQIDQCCDIICRCRK